MEQLSEVETSGVQCPSFKCKSVLLEEGDDFNDIVLKARLRKRGEKATCREAIEKAEEEVVGHVEFGHVVGAGTGGENGEPGP